MLFISELTQLTKNWHRMQFDIDELKEYDTL